MSNPKIYADQIQASNWSVGVILEDVRHDSPTQGCQFEIVDHEDNVIEVRQLEDNEYVVPSEIFSRIK